MTNSLADLRRARSLLVYRDRDDLDPPDHRQRPRLPLAELARTRDVLVVDPAIVLDDVSRPTIAVQCLAPGLYRAQPRLPATYRGRESSIHCIVRALLLELIASNAEFVERFDAPIQWFCTPMPAPAMIGAFRDSAVVYARRTAAPRDRDERAYDRFLLDRADLVVTAD